MSGEGVLANDCRFARHADFCDWHVDQYSWECTCGAIPNAASTKPAWIRTPERRDRTVTHGLERHREDNAVVTAAACGTRYKPDWYCSREDGHPGPCAAWPVSHATHREAYAEFALAHIPAKQSKADSFMESLTNIAVGLAVSQAANFLIIPLVLGVPLSQRESFALGAAYTVVSLVRSYTLRRAFNGRSVWQAIKAACA